MRKKVPLCSAGFTLVEMLLVIAAIALLISILLPSFAKARDGVYTDICQNNLRNIMQGTIGYSVEHRSLLPSPNWGGYGIDVLGWTGGGWLYHNRNKATLNSNAHWNLDLLKSGNIFPYVSAAGNYRCPNDKAPYVPLSGQLTSYNMNGSSIAYGAKPVPFSINNFSSKSVMFWEVDAENFSTGWWWDGGNFPWEGLSQTRHFDGGTVINVDLSSERWDFEEYYAEEARRPGRLWNVPTPNGTTWPG